MSSPKRPRQETTAPSTEPPAKKAKIQTYPYLLCGSWADECDLNGYMYTPKGIHGKKVIQRIIDKKISKADKGEIIDALISILDGPESPKSDYDKKERARQSRVLLGHLPFLEKEDLQSLGTVEYWDPHVFEPVRVVHYSKDY